MDSFLRRICCFVEMYFALMVAVLFVVSSEFADAAREPCGPNEVRQKCGSACPPTCQNPNTAATSCIALCKDACFCKSGYLRDEVTKKCIPICQCPRSPST